MQTSDRSDLVITLHAAAEGGAAHVGTKAETLGRLVRMGFAVPEGVVLPVAVAARVAEAAGLGADATPDEVSAAPLPDDVEAALAGIAARFGDAVLAVRSSAVAEDRPDASFAGLYDTVLGVRGLDALRAAVRRCWASAHGERVRAYPGARGAAPTGVAVLVQRQVDADVAGVAFSANPVTGARDEVLVSAVPGLGDALVSGRQTPDEWVVKGTAATAVRVTHQALAEPQVRAVADLARRVKAALGGPQDVEWAMADGRLVVLQARPVTALPQRPVFDVPPGMWVKDAARYAEPMTAFGAALVAPAIADGLSRMFATYGGLLDRMEVRCLGGEMYLHPVPPGGREGSPPPWWVLAVLARVAPPLRARMRAARRTTTPERIGAQIDAWYADWRPQVQAEIATLRAVDLAALDDGELAAHLGTCIDTGLRWVARHFQLIPACVLPMWDLVEAGRALLGWTEAQTLALVTGTSTATSSPSRELAALARRIRDDPAARAAVERGAADLAPALAAADPALGEAFAGWCERFAFRCVNDDPGSPLLEERPWLIARLLREAMTAADEDRASRGDATRRAAQEQARAALAGRSAADRERFERVLAAALRSYPFREDNTMWTASVPMGLVRRAVVEAGRRLVVRGLLDSAEHVVDLDHETIHAALTGAAPDDLRARAARARAERAWVSAHPGPVLLGTPAGGPTDVRGLPRAGRRLNRALMWMQPSATAVPAPSAASAALTGAPASPGRYTGPVRVVRGEADFHRLQPGDVLVCPTTDPAWSVLFGIAGALVTEGGGLLSHAAIVAREHAIPAVVGTVTATGRLHDGDLVTVDGTAGVVTTQTHREGEPS